VTQERSIVQLSRLVFKPRLIKIFRLIKMHLKDTYSTTRTRKYLLDTLV